MTACCAGSLGPAFPTDDGTSLGWAAPVLGTTVAATAAPHAAVRRHDTRTVTTSAVPTEIGLGARGVAAGARTGAGVGLASARHAG